MLRALCSRSSPVPLKRRPRNSRTCGGFFDVATLQKRRGELDSLMAGEAFWNNREQAQKFIDEANTIRGKSEPLAQAEKQLEDFRVMIELGEAEAPTRKPNLKRNSKPTSRS